MALEKTLGCTVGWSSEVASWPNGKGLGLWLGIGLGLGLGLGLGNGLTHFFGLFFLSFTHSFLSERAGRAGPADHLIF